MAPKVVRHQVDANSVISAQHAKVEEKCAPLLHGRRHKQASSRLLARRYECPG